MGRGGKWVRQGRGKGKYIQGVEGRRGSEGRERSRRGRARSIGNEQ